MAQRGMTAAVLLEVVKSATKFVHLVQVQYGSGTIYMTDAYRAIAYGGHTYQALGHFLGFDGIEEAAELKTTQVRVSLSGVDQSEIAEVIDPSNYLGQTLIIYGAFLDASEALIADPFIMLQGPMDGPVIEEDPASGKCTVTVPVTSLGTDFDSPAGRHTSVAEQQQYFPTDTGFKMCPQIAGQLGGRLVLWGRPGAQP